MCDLDRFFVQLYVESPNILKKEKFERSKKKSVRVKFKMRDLIYISSFSLLDTSPVLSPAPIVTSEQAIEITLPLDLIEGCKEGV